jgi:hypothetical protein
MRGRLLRRLTGTAPRYSTRGKLDGLRHLLNGESGEPGIGDVTLDALKTRVDLPTQLMITAFDYDRQREIFFRSNNQSPAADFGAPAIATLAEAIHAATTAPLGFFDAPASVSRGRRCWDAALIGHNNPVLAAVAEALASGVEAQAIEVLSIGTGGVVLPMAAGNEDSTNAKLVRRRMPAGEVGDLRKVADTLLDDPPDTASLTAYLALGHPVPADGGERLSAGRLVRMNPLVQPIRLANGWVRPAGLNEAEDGSDEFVRLRELAVDAGDADEIALVQKFGALWHGDAVVNQPVRANADTLDCEIGQRWYSEAKAQWQALLQPRAAAASAPPTSHTVSPGTAARPAPAVRHSGSKIG